MPAFDDVVRAAHDGGLASMVDLRLEVSRMLGSGVSDRSQIEAFLRGGSPRDWITFDQSVRAYWYGEESASWQSWWKRAWKAIQPGGESIDLLAVGLSSMDRDGRIREEAIRKLAREADSLIGPFLALRTTDWVDQVSTLATEVLAHRIRISADVLIASAPILFALSDRRRRSAIESVVLERAAADSGVRAALLTSADRRTRRRTIADERVREAASLGELVTLSQTDPDAVVASAAGLEAVSRVASNDAQEVLDDLLKGPALVRRAVLDGLTDLDSGRVRAERHLFDRSPTVRSAAQRVYRRAGGSAADIYRAALTRGERVPIAVTELAVLGSAADHAVVLRALGSDDAASRRAAVNAVRWIAPYRLLDLIAPLLWDSSPGVSRAAERRLRTKARDLEKASLLDLAAAPRAHQRLAAYRLLRRRSAPERIEGDLIALADADEHVRRDAMLDLRSWLGRGSASSPRADLATRQRLSGRLDAVDHLLPAEDVARIRFHAGLRAQDLRA